MGLTPWKPWPRSVQFAGVIALGFVMGALRIGVWGTAVVCAIAAALALGRP